MSNRYTRFLLTTLLASSLVRAADGDLDATFGSGGKVQISVATEGHGTSSIVATDVAVQSGGKIIVAGYDDQSNCFVARLNVNGTLDTNFAGGNNVGNTPGFIVFSNGFTSALAAARPDDRVVVLANGTNGFSYLFQFSANGALDTSFGAGGVAGFPRSAGDTTHLSGLVIDSDGTIDVAGTYYANQSGFNSNEFYFVRISADGHTVEPFQYQFGTGANQDDHATDLAVDSQGRYVLAGYHRGASGNYGFAAIRIQHDLYDVDNTFGNAGQTTIDFGDNGDYANAVALTPTGYIALGGRANGQAALVLLDPAGNLNQYFSGGLLYSDKFVFNFGTGGGNDTIAKLILDGYDTQYPQLLAIGSGNQSYASGPGGAAGLMFGVARLNLPGTYSNFSFDTTFGGDGAEGVYFAVRPSGIGSFLTTNNGRSAAFAHGKLIAVGDTLASGGTDMAATRLAAFDGIFKNGFDNPSL